MGEPATKKCAASVPPTVHVSMSGTVLTTSRNTCATLSLENVSVLDGKPPTVPALFATDTCTLSVPPHLHAEQGQHRRKRTGEKHVRGKEGESVSMGTPFAA